MNIFIISFKLGLRFVLGLLVVQFAMLDGINQFDYTPEDKLRSQHVQSGRQVLQVVRQQENISLMTKQCNPQEQDCEGSSEDCDDIAPEGFLQCTDYLEIGKCDVLVLENYCRATCGSCCVDEEVNKFMTCKEIFLNDKCDGAVLAGKCLKTCGACEQGISPITEPSIPAPLAISALGIDPAPAPAPTPTPTPVPMSKPDPISIATPITSPEFTPSPSPMSKSIPLSIDDLVPVPTFVPDPTIITESINCTEAINIECDREALLTIKSNLDLNSQQFYSSWSGKNPCDGNWIHIVCSPIQGETFFRVTELQFSPGYWIKNSNGDWENKYDQNKSYIAFNQPLPPELTKMHFLEQMEMCGNRFSGSIFPEISTMTNLKVLDMDQNDFQGSIPSEISLLENLVMLRTARNKITGALPKEFSALNNMRKLFVHENNLNGTLPVEYSLLSKIQVFWVQENNLDGKLPPQYSLFNPNTQLNLSQNSFSGNLPVEFSRFLNLSASPQNGDLCVINPAIFQTGVDVQELALCQ